MRITSLTIHYGAKRSHNFQTADVGAEMTVEMGVSFKEAFGGAVDYRCPACLTPFTWAEVEEMAEDLGLGRAGNPSDVYCPNCCRTTLEPRRECPECGGLGLLSRHDRDTSECNRCMGEGEIYDEELTGPTERTTQKGGD